MKRKDNFPSEKTLKKLRAQLSKGIASKPLGPEATAIDQIKYTLCEKIVIYMNEHNLKQRRLSEILGENESLISKIIHYHFDEFTIDRLIKFVRILYPKAEIKVDVAS